jgi:hypothetical protein
MVKYGKSLNPEKNENHQHGLVDVINKSYLPWSSNWKITGHQRPWNFPVLVPVIFMVVAIGSHWDVVVQDM